MLLSTGCIGLTSESEADTKAPAEEFRTVVDSRGVSVQVPAKIERVVTVSDALVEGTMFALGVEDKIVGIGSSCIPMDFEYSYPLDDGSFVNGTGGRDVVKVLAPRVAEQPAVIKSGTAMNYETLATLDPDVVILRIGCCAIQNKVDENTIQTIETIESLGFPVVVLYSPNCYEQPKPATISEEIEILGRVFDKEEDAKRIGSYLESQVALVEERTRDIPESEKSTVMSFGLSPIERKNGAAGNAHGLKTTEGYIIENIAHAKNAFRGDGRMPVSTEQVLAMDSDVIVLCTSRGYHTPGELYDATYYAPLRELSAVRNRRVYSLPWSPCNCAMRLEHPIDVMVIAKAAYPERFADIDLGEWLLDFYKNVYGVDEDTAKALRSAQWMDWCVESGE
ncbi:ABC transporter substrate-binding protein [Methanosarcina sp. Mfa9]|uniref:ABC transporter substrate-binding protein n=1 Tax=Methanosarcina sp. Mfa9 TaxID=3439063 RepID=UPI003F85A631